MGDCRPPCRNQRPNLGRCQLHIIAASHGSVRKARPNGRHTGLICIVVEDVEVVRAICGAWYIQQTNSIAAVTGSRITADVIVTLPQI